MAIDRHPPGPAGNWLLGNTRLLKQDMLRLLKELPQEYGDVIRLRFGSYRALLLSHPSSIQQVLVTEGNKFEKPPRFLRIVRPAFGNGLFANRGAAWKQQRRRMQALLDTVDLEDHCRNVVHSVQRTVAAWPDGEENDRDVGVGGIGAGPQQSCNHGQGDERRLTTADSNPS